MLQIFQRILHPTDFSVCSEAALSYALDLARRSEAELHLLHVAPALGENPLRGAFEAVADEKAFYRQQRDEADRRMQEMLARHETAGLAVKRVHSRSMVPGAAIAEYAEAEDIDLVVIGTHGRRGVRHLLLGSVAEEVVRSAPCPVLTVGAQDGRPTVQPALGRILVSLDFSSYSMDALRYARDLATSYGARVDLLHVVEPAADAALYRASLRDRARMEQGAVEQARGRLERIRREAEGTSGQPFVCRVVVGYPPDRIVRLAREGAADLIVVASHGQSGPGQCALGNVVERVVRTAPCPVFTTKPFGEALRAFPERALRLQTAVDA